MFRAPPPERRRRGDLVAAAVLVAGVVVAGTVLAATSDVAATTGRVAATPIVTPPPAVAAPAAFVEAWRAPSATAAPVLAGPAVVTAEGGTVSGRDAATGAAAWSYARDLPLCTVGSGFPQPDDPADPDDGPDPGRALVVHATGPLDDPGTWCSELTMLSGATGQREGARNPDARPGTRLVADDTYVVATGADHLEAWRSDLVRTVEYGDVPAQEQAGRQPRSGCTHGSVALGGRHTGVVERCPGEGSDRLTVLVTDGKDGADTPEVVYSVPLPGTGAVVVAVEDDRAAVALPSTTGPGRLAVHDAAGAQIAVTEVEHAAGDPPGGVAPTTADERFRFWFTGSSVVALDAGELAPVWTFPGALGPPVRYGTDLLVPVSGGLQVVDDRGQPRRLIPVERADPTAPVAPAVLGDVLLEQRGGELVALVAP